MLKSRNSQKSVQSISGSERKDVTATPRLFSQNTLRDFKRDEFRNDKQFVKELDVEAYCFNYICKNFPKLGMEKLKGGPFVGPQL